MFNVLYKHKPLKLHPKSIILLFIALLVFFSVSITPATNSYAAPGSPANESHLFFDNKKVSPQDQIEMFELSIVMIRCMRDHGTTGGGWPSVVKSQKDLDNLSFFQDDKVIYGYSPTTNFSKEGDNNIRIKCSNTDWLKRLASLLGYKNKNAQFICDVLSGNGAATVYRDTDNIGGDDDKEDKNCSNGSGDVYIRLHKGDMTNSEGSVVKYNSEAAKLIQRSLSHKLGIAYDALDEGRTIPKGADGAKYVLYHSALVGACNAKEDPDVTGSSAYKDIKVAKKDGDKYVVKTVTYRGKKHDSYNDVASGGNGKNGVNCDAIAQRASDSAEGYVNHMNTYYSAHKDETPPPPPGTGASNSSGSSEDDEDETSSCQVDGVGWIVCPVTNFMASVSDGAFAVLSHFLTVKSELVSTKSGTYEAWKAFRTIANVAFIAVFLIIIYSQLTSMGISNYGIKKMFPRLIIAAVLVNLSFFICQLFVDVSNILGVSLKDMLAAINVNGSGQPYEPGAANTFSNILAGTGAVVLIGGAIATAIVAVLSVGLPVLLFLLLALLMILVILIARQAGIVILTVLAPLAFVAYILPNTEQWFKKWYKMFWGLLLVFPVVSLLYGGGQLAARVLSKASEGAGAEKIWFVLMAMGVSAIPLIMTPSLLKGSMKATGALGAKLSGFGDKATGKVKSSGKEGIKNSRTGEAWRGMQRNRQLSKARRRANPGRVKRALDNSRFGRRYGLDRGAASAEAAVKKDVQTDFDNAEARVQDVDVGGMQESTYDSNGKIMNKGEFLKKYESASDAEKAALLSKRIETKGIGKDEQGIIDEMSTTKPTNANQRALHKKVAGTLKDSGLIDSKGASAITYGNNFKQNKKGQYVDSSGDVIENPEENNDRLVKQGIGDLINNQAGKIEGEKIAGMDSNHIETMKGFADDKGKANMGRAANDALTNENIPVKNASTRGVLEGLVGQATPPSGSRGTETGGTGSATTDGSNSSTPAATTPAPQTPQQTPQRTPNPHNPNDWQTTDGGLIIPREDRH